MTKTRHLVAIVVFTVFTIASQVVAAASPESSAMGVITRTVGSRMAKSVSITIKPDGSNNPSYEYHAEKGRLYISASTPVAACRGFYDYLRSAGIGMIGWRGPVLNLPASWPDAPLTKVTSPFKIKQMYNVVTAGYSFPYWNWDRWEHELDWLALHGYNMIMAPLATEAIAQRVWLKIGLSQDDIDAFTCGPAHAPWFRMGNISHTDGPLPQDWHRDQIALQHKILNRMHELGIQPIIQSFAGFVPHATRKLYPNEKYFQSSWNSGFRGPRAPIYILPESKLFKKIFQLYITEWQCEFGPGKYFLIDTFNEIKHLPSKLGMTTEEVMAEYGHNLSKQITDIVPDGVWVLQGWIFGYQRHLWKPSIVKSLFSKVPNGNLLILDMIAQWDHFEGYYGKPWIYGIITNMGGRTPYAGKLHDYINGPDRMLKDSHKNRITGFSNHSEGIEVSEVNFELISDVGWHTGIKLNDWLQQFCRNRYGKCPPEMLKAWQGLADSCFKNKGWYARFSWQSCSTSTKKLFSQKFIDSAMQFLSLHDQFRSSPFYTDDAVEMASFILGQQADSLYYAARQALSNSDMEAFKPNLEGASELLRQADRLLESHSLNRLERWVGFARTHGPTPELRSYYEENARRIITSWGPPVNDYSARVWSGLIRDFYIPRMKAMLEAKANSQGFNRNKWEERWINSTDISPCEPFSDPAAKAFELASKALQHKPIATQKKTAPAAGEIIGDWSPGEMSTDWHVVQFPITPDLAKKLLGVRFVFTKGNHMLRIRKVELVCDGNVVDMDKHDGSTGNSHIRNSYYFKAKANRTANNGAFIRATVRSDGGTRSYGRVESLLKKQ